MQRATFCPRRKKKISCSPASPRFLRSSSRSLAALTRLIWPRQPTKRFMRGLPAAGVRMPVFRIHGGRACLPRRSGSASACLASRLPYGTEVTPERLGLVARGEAALRALGFRQFRVRPHDKLARVEISPDEMARALAPEMAAAIADRLKAVGFTYVALDLQGYRQGSVDQTRSLPRNRFV